MDKFPEIPGYRIQSTLGEGGMATVYLAVQESFERPVALKVLSPILLKDPSFSERFLREAKIVANLSHQNIIPVFEMGKSGESNFIAMEYLSGGNFSDKLAQGISLTDGLNVIKQAASALNYAGNKGVIHRDIKPANIMFREDGSAVLTDFGIATQSETQAELTMTGVMIGTPKYMSPEQAKGISVDTRTDLYSLGVILYELLAGKIPFSGSSAISITYKHVHEEPPPLPPQTEAFQSIIDIALAKDPKNRYQSGFEFVGAIEHLENRLSSKTLSRKLKTSPITYDSDAVDTNQGSYTARPDNTVFTQAPPPSPDSPAPATPRLEKQKSNIFATFLGMLSAIFLLPFKLATELFEEIHAFFRDTFDKAQQPEAKPKEGVGASIISDKPIVSAKNDKLGFSIYSDAIAGVIDHPNVSTPLTIAINAEWGMGKTSLANLTEEKLKNKIEDKNEDHHTSCWFNAKNYTSQKDLNLTFVGELCRELHSRLAWYKRIIHPLPNSLCTRRHVQLRKILLVCTLLLLCILAATAMAPALITEKISDSAFSFIDLNLLTPTVSTVAIIVIGGILLLQGLNTTMASLSRYVKNASEESSVETHDKMRGEIQRLVKQLTPKHGKFVLFIDDIERCGTNNATAVLELASQLMKFERAVTIVLTDINFLIDTYQTKHKDLADSYEKNQAKGNEITYGRDYLQKIIQLQFDLPSHGERIENLIFDKKQKNPIQNNTMSDSAQHHISKTAISKAREYLDEKIADHGATMIVNKPADIGVNSKEWRALELERKQRYLGKDSPLLVRASNEANKYIRPIPRLVKRTHNHLCIMIFILHRKHLLHSNSELQPEQVGKWVAMKECWPKTTEKIIRHPKHILELEKTASKCSIDEKGSPSIENSSEHELDHDQAEFYSCLKSDPQLSPVISKLINFE